MSKSFTYQYAHTPVYNDLSDVEIGVPRIITHNDFFKLEDVLATALVRVFLPGYENAPIIRTNDVSNLQPHAEDPSAVFIHIGNEYDVARELYDNRAIDKTHHPRKMTAIGLVWVRVLNSLDPSLAQHVASFVLYYDHVVRTTGALDTSLGGTIYRCNNFFNTVEVFDRFDQLVHWFAAVIRYACLGEQPTPEDSQVKLTNLLLSFHNIKEWIREYKYHMENSAVEVRSTFATPGPLLVFDRYEPAFTIIAPQAPIEKLFAVYPTPTGDWIVQQISATEGALVGRKNLPSSWLGLRDEALDTVTGIPGCVICLPDGSAIGHHTKEGAEQLALLAAVITT
jgi:uncharacterized UPF0160 family protein